MRLIVKILFTLLAVAIIPVAVSGISSALIATEAITETAGEKLEGEARHLAELSEQTILGAVDDLTQASSLNLAALTPAELTGALWLIYREEARYNAVALIDGRTGEQVVDLVFQAEVDRNEVGLAEHAAFAPANMEAFATHIPLAEALSSGRAISVPYTDPERGLPLIALAARVDGPSTARGPSPWVLAVEFNLGPLNRRFEEAGEEGLVAYLVDTEGRTVCHTDRALALARPLATVDPAAAALKDPMATNTGIINQEGDDIIAAWARAERLAEASGRSWGVILERPKAAVLARVDDMIMRSGFWVGVALVLSLLAGFVLAQGIARPLELLTLVVGRFGTGETHARARVSGHDEIARLGGAFNHMADAIAERDKELRSFNEELQERVNERTMELKEAQDQLIRSQKAAAVGELGAGVAHEINNPLAAVLGSAQLALLRTDRDATIRPQLEDIESEALRIRDIVEGLLKLSVEQGQEAASALDVNAIVDSALALCARQIIAQRIQVRKSLGVGLPRVRGVSAELQQVVMHLLNNAKEAMPDGGTLTVRTEDVDGKLAKIIVDDTGQGIAAQNLEKVYEPFFTTRAAKGHKGMGLAIVQRTVEEHGGRITIASRLGKGTSVKVSFPATREQLHLA